MNSSNKKYVEEYVTIGGIKQYFLYYNSNPDQPVFLFIHGGPGQSEAYFAYTVEEFEKRNYNIVYYDQRGAGKTYLKNKSTPSFNLLKQDLLEVILYIKDKYQKEKIGIIGHSWGSVLGSMLAIEHPEHCLCYIGCGQVIDSFQNEIIGLDLLKKEINKNNDIKDLKKINNIGEYPVKYFNSDVYQKIKVVRKLQGKYKLALAVNKKMIKIVMKSPIFKFKDIITFFKCFKVNIGVMDEMMRYNLYDYGTEYEIPIYYILGEKDQQTPIEISMKYFDCISAPEKKLYLIPNAGHLTMLDNTKEYRNALCDVSARLRIV